MRHPTTEAILDFLENKADSENCDALQEHLASCSRCESKSREFQKLTGFLQEDAANEPPAHLLEWSVGCSSLYSVHTKVPCGVSLEPWSSTASSNRFRPVSGTWAASLGSCCSRPAMSTSMSGSNRKRTIAFLWRGRLCRSRQTSSKTRPSAWSLTGWFASRHRRTPSASFRSTECPRTPTIFRWIYLKAK